MRTASLWTKANKPRGKEENLLFKIGARKRQTNGWEESKWLIMEKILGKKKKRKAQNEKVESCTQCEQRIKGKRVAQTGGVVSVIWLCKNCTEDRFVWRFSAWGVKFQNQLLSYLIFYADYIIFSYLLLWGRCNIIWLFRKTTKHLSFCSLSPPSF